MLLFVGNPRTRIWKPTPTGQFSTKVFYLALEGPSQPRSACALFWLGQAAPKVEAFCWLAIAGKVSVADRLRRGITSENISNICVISRKKKEEESTNNLFIHSKVASEMWNYFILSCKAAWFMLSSLLELAEAWRWGPFHGFGLILWRIILYAIIWSISKERNDKTFWDASSFIEELQSLANLRIAKWVRQGKSSQILGWMMFCITGRFLWLVVKSRREGWGVVACSPPLCVEFQHGWCS